MLPIKFLHTLKELALAQKTLPTAATDAVPKTGQFEPGQKIQGMVQNQVSPGLFNVRVGEQLTQMLLPDFVHSGDMIKLQVISTTPHLTFSMSASSNPLSTQEQLSSISRLLSALSQQPREQIDMHAMKSSSVWTTPQTMQNEQLAGLLHDALSNSGLFYESHQVQWLEGTRSTSQLLQEPQNSVTVNPSINSKELSLSDGTVPFANQLNTAASTEGKAPLIPYHLQPLVQQQINVLETQQVLWQGNIWPGQAMQWEVHEQPSHNTSATDNQQQWTTQINLDLPNLGMISAILNFNNAGLNLTLNASSAATLIALGNASSQLVATMSDCGIKIVNTLITQHESTQ
ncbi:Flg_hook domain-containing protein [Candidatus Nitrotoga sp. HW29]|uniref:flagellar hook-length control protein FliK n=1 Tax=Candidatus Nitrotoga sp. HW29 TaxID=2886963 RepID=UPI001EF2586A|nr:flagellar hook-length control protein FliK [Candidatus Nitrotoga sp. HW29]CAH1903607.1 Flg_hook domain-containing protein [Candidatus Nitrotoga sp. HW29]